MKDIIQKLCVAALYIGISGCDGPDLADPSTPSHGHAPTEAEPPKGPHGGRLLTDGSFALELAIFETGVPPEYRVWATQNGQQLSPDSVDLEMTLTRLGGAQDDIRFAAQDDFLRGDTVVYEPHSFVVSIAARYGNETFRWEYENFEGRTRINPELADAFELATETAGPATIRETVTAYGHIVPDPERVHKVVARFDGEIKSVNVSLGQMVRAGQVLATVESNESLRAYDIKTPIEGVVIQRNANPTEQAGERQLFTIMDSSVVWAELAVFPSDRNSIQPGAQTKVRGTDQVSESGTIDWISAVAQPNQSVPVRVRLANPQGTFVPGMAVTGEVLVAEHAVPLAVKRQGLQSFRDFTVVYAQIGDEYEVRMLDLGRQDNVWVEVLGGLEPGTRYVTENSYLVKADIEKSGASHDH